MPSGLAWAGSGLDEGGLGRMSLREKHECAMVGTRVTLVTLNKKSSRVRPSNKRDSVVIALVTYMPSLLPWGIA
jgi:hypothetical protein